MKMTDLPERRPQRHGSVQELWILLNAFDRRNIREVLNLLPLGWILEFEWNNSFGEKMCKVSIQIRSHFCHFYPIRVSSFLLSFTAFTSITRFERRKVMAKEVNLLKACLDEDDPMDMLRASAPEKNTHQNTLRFSSFFYCNPFEILFSALQILLLLLQWDNTIGASHCRTTYHPVNHYDNLVIYDHTV